MAFNARGLQIDRPAGSTGAGPDKFLFRGTYITEDAKAAVEAAGYFNDAWKRLRKNTILTVVSSSAGTPKVSTYIVTASSASAVTIVLQTTAAG